MTRRATPIDIEIGRRIKAERIRAGLSQHAFGDALGITFQQIQKYENGANRVASGRMVEIALTLNISVLTFFEGIEAFVPKPKKKRLPK